MTDYVSLTAMSTEASQGRRFAVDKPQMAFANGSPGVEALTFALILAGVTATALHVAPERSAAGVVGALAVLWGCGLHCFRLPTHPAVVLASAVLIRTIFIGTPPLLSDDLYRYLWEGRLLLEGGNPFLTPPTAITGLDDELRALVNHPDIPSLYPPLALWWFQFLAVLGRTPEVAQATTALVDVGIVAALLRVRLLPQRAALYALHPLPILEAASGAHIDTLALFLATLALTTRGGTLWALLGGVTKLLPLALIPPLLSGQRPTAWVGTGVAGVGITICLAWPVLDAGPALFTALGTYAHHWTFNPVAYPLLAPFFGLYTRGVLAAIGLFATLYIWRVSQDPWSAFTGVGVTFLIVSPTVHPWYVLWVFLPAAVTGRRDLTFAASFFQASYVVLFTLDPATGTWGAGPWLAAITWLPAVLAILVGRLSGRRLKTPPSHTQPRTSRETERL